MAKPKVGDVVTKSAWGSERYTVRNIIAEGRVQFMNLADNITYPVDAGDWIILERKKDPEKFIVCDEGYTVFDSFEAAEAEALRRISSDHRPKKRLIFKAVGHVEPVANTKTATY